MAKSGIVDPPLFFVERVRFLNLTINVPETFCLLRALYRGAEMRPHSMDKITNLHFNAAAMKVYQLRDLQTTFHSFQHLFKDRLGHTTVVERDIELTSETLVRFKAYRTSPLQKKICAQSSRR